MGLRNTRSVKYRGLVKVVRGSLTLIAASLIFHALLLWGAASAADPQPSQERGNGSRRDAQPLDHLLPGIRLSHPGELSDAHGPTYDQSRNPHYHLKWITPDGDVNWLDADAQSGQVLRTSPGRDSFDDR